MSWRLDLNELQKFHKRQGASWPAEPLLLAPVLRGVRSTCATQHLITKRRPLHYMTVTRVQGVCVCVCARARRVPETYFTRGTQRVIAKRRNPLLTHVLYVKNKVHWDHKTKTNVTPSLGNVQCVTKFGAYRANCGHLRPERFLSWALPPTPKRFIGQGNVNLFGTRESENASLNSFWQV
jgi:hypothetical protein